MIQLKVVYISMTEYPSQFIDIYQYVIGSKTDNHQLIQFADNEIISICNFQLLGNYIFIETSNKVRNYSAISQVA